MAQRERDARRRLPLRIAAVALLALLVAVSPLTAFATIWFQFDAADLRTIYVGQAVGPDPIRIEARSGPDSASALSITNFTLPAGITMNNGVPGPGTRDITGTAAPGTVGGTYKIVSTDTGDNDTQTFTIVVAKGPQTIVCAPATVQMGSTVTLAPYSTNGNGAQIPSGSIDAPSYTFISNDPAIASVDLNTGLITPVAPGVATITISSDMTDSYVAAADLIVTVTVTAAVPARGGSSSSSEPSPPPAHEKATIGHCAEWANIRSGPGTNFGIIGRVYLGDTVELLQWNTDGEWCKVLYGGGSNVGWLHGKYIIPSK